MGRTVFVGSQKGELVSLNLDNGKVYWKFNTGAPIGESSPAYSAGVVYVGNLEGWLNALNASDGKKLWAFKTGSEIKSSPVVVGDRVLIGSYDQYLYCLSARNGSVLWKVRTDGPVHATPSVSGGTAFITGCDEVFRAIRIADGHQIFQMPLGRIRRFAGFGRRPGFYGTFNNDVLMVNLAQRRSRGAINIRAESSVLLISRRDRHRVVVADATSWSTGSIGQAAPPGHSRRTRALNLRRRSPAVGYL